MRKSKFENRETIEDLIKDPDSYTTWSDKEEEEAEEIRTLISTQIWGDE